MGRVPGRFVSVMVLVAFCCCASAAWADPVRVTSGVVQAGFGPLSGPWDAQALQLIAPGFAIGSSLEDEKAFVQLGSTPTIEAGALTDLSGVLSVADPLGVQLGNSSGIVAPFNLFFDASPARLTCSSGGSLTECIARAPFTFHAELAVTPMGGVPTTYHLMGGGMAEGSLFRSGSRQSGAVRYTFDASPVPEPATLSLLTVGAIGAVVSARRRRRAGRCKA